MQEKIVEIKSPTKGGSVSFNYKYVISKRQDVLNKAIERTNYDEEFLTFYISDLEVEIIDGKRNVKILDSKEISYKELSELFE